MRRGFAGAYSILSTLCVISTLFGVSPAHAISEIVPLERLHVYDVIYLPTVRSQYEATFTKPKTWQLSSNSKVYIEFQHSHELLPNRSWLQVIVNDQVIKHIPLTKENAQGSKLTLPLPIGALKDFNTLTFRVEQHYTDKCEDPLDKSLWTQILPATKIIFDYAPTVPSVTLNQYPYPIIDTLTYSPAKVHFVTSRNASASELQAMLMVNIHLAQQAQDHELMSRVTFGNSTGPDAEHVVLVGTPNNIPEAAKFQTAGAYALQNGQWVNKSNGQALSQDQGVIAFFQAPGSKEHTVLIVSGNSDEAVLKAARYLTTRPKLEGLSGQVAVVPNGWAPSGSRTNKVPRFIDNQSRTFRELGFEIQEVHKINAPPITYQVPIVSEFRKSGGKLWLDLNFSYSPKLNPEYSSLELRMNDVSIANIPLTNENGEQGKHVSIPVSSELIRTRNNLVAQFHLMPDKYGWCVDNYVDNAWGKIMDDSQFRVEGSVASRLPDVGLLNNTMYPYSKDDHLQNLQVVIPNELTPDLLGAVMGFTTRLGRITLADTDLRFSFSKGTANVLGDKNLAVFQNTASPISLPDGSHLMWKASGANLLKLLNLPEPNGKINAELFDLGQGADMEQYTQGNRIISVFSANGNGFNALAQLFNTDKTFETLNSGILQQLSKLNPDINAINEPRFHTEQKAAGNWWDRALSWLRGLPWMNILIGFVAAFFALLILPFIIGRLLRR